MTKGNKKGHAGLIIFILILILAIGADKIKNNMRKYRKKAWIYEV